MSYCSVAELKAQIVKHQADHDAILQPLIDAAKDAIDAFCNRPDGFVALTTATARLYVGDGSRVLWIDECVEVSLVEVKNGVADAGYVTWTTSDWLAATGDPHNPIFNRTPYTFLIALPTGSYSAFTNGKRDGYSLPTGRITSRWGYAASAPPRVKQACLTQAARWYQRGKSGWGDALVNQDFGMVLYKKPLDPDVQMMLMHGRLVKMML
jgi:hypothetical protein